MAKIKGNAKARWRKGAMGCLVKTPSWKETELHHEDAVNQELVAGQSVEITQRAVNQDIRGEIGEFVGYTDVLVEIDGEIRHVVTNSLDEVVRDSQSLRHGDEVRTNQRPKKEENRGRTGRFVEYIRVVVNIDGAEYGLSPNSVERV